MIGTLQELNLKVGDWVVCVDSATHLTTVGKKYEVVEWTYNKKKCAIKDDSDTFLVNSVSKFEKVEKTEDKKEAFKSVKDAYGSGSYLYTIKEEGDGFTVVVGGEFEKSDKPLFSKEKMQKLIIKLIAAFNYKQKLGKLFSDYKNLSLGNTHYSFAKDEQTKYYWCLVIVGTTFEKGKMHGFQDEAAVVELIDNLIKAYESKWG